MLRSRLEMKYPAVVINIPGSLVQPGLTRKEAFLTQWDRSGLNERFELIFLENVCTPAEIVQDEHLLALAKKHDTFIQPGLRKALLQVDPTVSLTEEQKKVATTMVETMIDHWWEPLVTILRDLNFSCQDTEAVARVPNSPVGNPEVLAGLLDAVRTKLTRTACTESHIRAYRKLQALGDEVELWSKLHSVTDVSPVGLLLEDDLVILPQVSAQIESMLTCFGRQPPYWYWNTVQLGWSQLHDRPCQLVSVPGAPLITSSNGAYGNTAVLVNLARHAAAKIVDLIEEARSRDACIVANDVILARHCHKRYLAWPRYCGPPIGNHLSVIVGKNMDYTQVCWDPEQVAQIQALQ